MEGASGGDDHEDPSDQPASKKRYHRHTVQQTRQLEMFFKECPHPDEKQRQDLSRELGLEPRQVKFWFQNRRTQMKAHHERADNSMLRAENESLRVENMALHDALKNANCPKCGGALTPGEITFGEQHLRLENSRLKDELNRLTAMLARHMARSSAPNILPDFPFDITAGLDYHQLEPPPPGGAAAQTPEPAPSLLELANRPGGLTDSEKQLVAELAIVAMEELLRVAGAQASSSDATSLWISHEGSSSVRLNVEEYSRQFTRGMGLRPLMGLNSEASKETGVVMMSAEALVDSVMSTGRWLDIFSSIVARGFTTEVLTTGVGSNWNNALQLLYAELQILSPLVPTRELYFLRYCKQHSDHVWAVVDVSIDGLRENAPPPTLFRCRMRPSGFLIEDLQNGCSKVTVLQHYEPGEASPSSRQMNIHGIFHELVSCGAAFGAPRWLAALQRQSERQAVLMSTSLSTRDFGAVSSVSGRRSMLLLAQRMTGSYCAGVSSSVIHSWTTLSGSGTSEGNRVMTRKSITGAGVVLSAATSLWMPESSQRLFEFLRDERLRSEWDILSNGGSVQEIARVPTGQDPGCVVSLFRVDALNSSQSNMLILQESSTDAWGSLIVYAPVDIPAMNLVLQGGDPAGVGLLPSGFAIVSDGAPLTPRTTTIETNVGSSSSSGGSTGSLLTVAFQILVSSVPTAKLNLESVATVNSLITSTIQRIKTALGC